MLKIQITKMLQRVMEALGANRFAGQRDVEESSATARMCAERVHKFSSQYGGEKTRGYTASNLAGESCKYPSYGDFSEACVMVCMSTAKSKRPMTPEHIFE